MNKPMTPNNPGLARQLGRTAAKLDRLAAMAETLKQERDLGNRAFVCEAHADDHHRDMMA